MYVDWRVLTRATVTHLQKLVMLLQIFVLEACPDLQKGER